MPDLKNDEREIVGASPDTGEVVVRDAQGNLSMVPGTPDEVKAGIDYVGAKNEYDTQQEAIRQREEVDRGETPEARAIQRSMQPSPDFTSVEVAKSTPPPQYANWTAEELKSGKVIEGVLTPSPFGVKGGVYTPYPDWAREKLSQAQSEAIEALQPYQTKVTQGDVSRMLSKGESKTEIVKASSLIGQNLIDISAAVKAGREAELKSLGVSKDTIEQAKIINKRLEEPKAQQKIIKPELQSVKYAELAKEIPPELWRQTKKEGEEFSQGYQDIRTGNVISREEYQKIKGPELDYYAKTIPETVARAGRLAVEQLVPGVYVARHWNELSPGERAFYLGIDALVVALPVAGAGFRGARAVGTATTVGQRLAASGRAAGAELGRQAIAPIEVLMHPLETFKFAGRQVRDVAEMVADIKRQPMSAIGTADGLLWFKVDKNMTEAEAIAIGDALANASKRGEKIVVVSGGRSYELRQAPILQVAGGGQVHSSPELRAFAEETQVAWKKGLPLKEQGWFLAPGGAERFVESSAFGKTTIPLPQTYNSKVMEVAKYTAEDIVRLDKEPVRPVDFSYAKNMPSDMAPTILDYIKKADAKVGGSFNQYMKVKKSPRPNDIDTIFNTVEQARQAQDDIIRMFQKAGYEARAKQGTRSIEYLDRKGQWKTVIDLDAVEHHDFMIPNKLVQAARRIDGIRFENLGEQYLRQSYGAISGGEKAGKRLKSLTRAADDVRDMLTSSGALKRIPGFRVISPEEASRTSSTGKLYQGIRELEQKQRLGTTIADYEQAIYVRYGPFSEVGKVWLSKKLSNAQLIKLKALGFVEAVRSPFDPPLKITDLNTGKRIKLPDIEELGKVLRKSGNASAADALLRADRLARAGRTTPHMLSRLVSTTPETLSTARAKLQRVNEARQRVVYMERLLRRLPRPSERQLNILQRVRAELKRVEGARLEDPRSEIARTEAPRAERTPTERLRGERLRIEPERVRPERPAPSRLTPERIRIPPPERTPLRIPPPERIPPGRIRIPPPDRIRIPPPKSPRINLPRLEPPRIPPAKIPLPTGNKKAWTPEEVRSAIAIKQGAVIHAIKAPYRYGIDEATFSVKNPPAGLKLLTTYKGPGSPQRSAKAIGPVPSRLTLDVGNQDVLITKYNNKLRVQYKPDRNSSTRSQNTITRQFNRPRRRRSRIFYG